jgi:MFS family permease
MYSVCVLCVGSWASGFASSYYWLLFLRFIVGFGVGGSTVPFDIFAEFLPPSSRGHGLTYTNGFWTLGEFYVVYMAYLLLSSNGWRGLIFATAIPVTIGGFMSYFILPESPRWLITQKRYLEAEEIIQNCAKYSSTKPTPYTFDPNITLVGGGNNGGDDLNVNGDDKSKHNSNPKTSFSNAFHQTIISYKEILFAPKLKWTTIKIGSIWLFFGMAYYGVVLLITHLYQNQSTSTSTSSKNQAVCDFDYGGIAINTSSEIVGIFLSLLTIDWLGRRGTQMWSYGVGALTLFLMGIIPLNKTSIPILGYIMRSE